MNVPIRTAYNQWTQFESFPEFMEGVESVTQLDDTRTALGGRDRGRQPRVRRRDHRAAPRRARGLEDGGGPKHAGVVTFHQLDDDEHSCHAPAGVGARGLLEKVGDWLQIVRLRVRGDLERSRPSSSLMAARPARWRGEVPGPHERGEGGDGAGSGAEAGVWTSVPAAPGRRYGFDEPAPPRTVGQEIRRESALPRPGGGPLPPAGSAAGRGAAARPRAARLHRLRPAPRPCAGSRCPTSCDDEENRVTP